MAFLLGGIVKKFLFIVVFLPSLLKAASSSLPSQRVDESYEDTKAIYSQQITLNRNSAVIISTVVVPPEAKGFRVFASSDGIRFAVGMSSIGVPALAAITTSTSPLTAEISSSSFAVGGIAINGQWETRLLPFDGSLRRLYFRAAAAGAVFVLEFFR